MMAETPLAPSSELTIVRADNEDLKQQIYRFRYEVYVGNMNRRQIYADHDRRIITEPLDERGVNYAAFRNGRLVGTCRRNYFDDDALSYYAKLYRIELFGNIPRSRISLTTKLMVLPELQGTSTPIRLIQQFATDGAAEGVMVDTLDCNQHLIRLFEKFGFFSYIGWRFHKEYGTVRPMFFPVDGINYQAAIHSPLCSSISPFVRDNEYNGYELIRRLAERPQSENVAEHWDRLKADENVEWESDNVLLLYASTSGSTKLLCEMLAAGSERANVEAINIADMNRLASLPSKQLVVLASPTYGSGDPHWLWKEKGSQIVSALPAGQRIALLVLGDSRGHPQSFAGGMRYLADLVRRSGRSLVGQVPANAYPLARSPAVDGDFLPGLAVEYRKNRREAIESTKRWLAGLISDASITRKPRECVQAGRSLIMRMRAGDDTAHTSPTPDRRDASCSALPH